MPAVSVIMPVYNTKVDYLKRAVQSILEQSFQDFELVIVDNCSTEDATCTYLKDLKQLFKSRVRVLSFADEIGPVQARNYGIHNSNGKYIAFMDSDDVALPSRLKEEFEYLESHPASALVCSRTKVLSEESFDPFKNFKSDHELELYLLFCGNPICTSSVMVRREILERKHLSFEAEYQMAEDYRLWSQLVFDGIHQMDKVLCLYRYHPSGVSHLQSGKQADAFFRARGAILREVFGESVFPNSLWSVISGQQQASSDDIKQFICFAEHAFTLLAERGYAREEISSYLLPMVRNLFYHTKGLRAQLTLFNSPLTKYFNLPLPWRLFCLITRGVL